VFEDGDYTKAVSLYRAILDEDPGNVAATNGLRDVTRAQSIEQKFVGGASQPAPLTLEQTRQLTRHLTEAQQLQADGEYDAAITAYEAALRIDPNNTRATAGLAATRKAKAAEAAALSGLRKKPGQ
jgi:tetratricopeptide (TPR) repeat protein